MVEIPHLAAIHGSERAWRSGINMPRYTINQGVILNSSDAYSPDSRAQLFTGKSVCGAMRDSSNTGGASIWVLCEFFGKYELLELLRTRAYAESSDLFSLRKFQHFWFSLTLCK